MSRDPQINIRVSPELKEEFREMCEYRNQSVNAELVRIIKKEVQAHQSEMEKKKAGNLVSDDLLKDFMEEFIKPKLEAEAKAMESHYRALFDKMAEKKLSEINKKPT